MSNAKVPETRLWEWLNQAKYIFRLDLHMERLENEIGAGMPDVEGCIQGTQFWIELKTEARPAKSSTLIKAKFQPKQPSWHKRRRNAGGNTYVLLQVGSGADAGRYLLPGIHITQMQKGLLEFDLEKRALISPRCTPADIIGAVATR